MYHVRASLCKQSFTFSIKVVYYILEKMSRVSSENWSMIMKTDNIASNHDSQSEIRAQVEKALMIVNSRPDSGLKGSVTKFECVDDSRWLQYRVQLRGQHNFWLYIGQTKKVLHHCRRMCRSHCRRLFHGILIKAGQAFDDILHAVKNCIRTALAIVPHLEYDPDLDEHDLRRMRGHRQMHSSDRSSSFAESPTAFRKSPHMSYPVSRFA